MIARSALAGAALRRLAPAAVVAALAAAPLPAIGYPGGTPSYQTDVAPFCASCHSSVSEDALAGVEGDRAKKELIANKHLAVILAGGKPGYAELSEGDRAKLVEQIRALDANTKIEMDFPPQVQKGETFQVIVRVTGGAGPVVGVGLVDRPHRWFARPASVVGWSVVGAPSIIGPDGQPQHEWLQRRPEEFGRGITFVNVTGIESDASQEKWASAKVIYTLRAPDKPGNYPLVGVLFYGSEKGSPLGYETHPVYGKQPRGGLGGASGRVKFTDTHVITVK
jgi:hypothetical protein